MPLGAINEAHSIMLFFGKAEPFAEKDLWVAISAGASEPQFTKPQGKCRFLLAVARRNDNEWSFSANCKGVPCQKSFGKFPVTRL
ncbi:MAG TPA: hypothetical protein VNF00_01860 [Candidatus Acidoferrales bacterium]|nr:hypothetical protein [Candidatus Acidoferrales bacterium]